MTATTRSHHVVSARNLTTSPLGCSPVTNGLPYLSGMSGKSLSVSCARQSCLTSGSTTSGIRLPVSCSQRAFRCSTSPNNWVTASPRGRSNTTRNGSPVVTGTMLMSSIERRRNQQARKVGTNTWHQRRLRKGKAPKILKKLVGRAGIEPAAR